VIPGADARSGRASTASPHKSPTGRLASGVIAVLLVGVACTIGDKGDPGAGRAARRQPLPEPPAPATRPAAGSCAGLGRLVARIRRGYVAFASPDLMLIPRAPNYVGSPSIPPHSGPWDYLARVPLVFYGPGVVPPTGPLPAPATTADIAPTLASLVGFDGWPERAGRNLARVTRRGGPRPRLVVVIVWDGGGWNALRRHPAAWPHLRRMSRRGASFPRMVIGSSPSVTAPVHATLGTGTWPRAHGIPALNVRTPEDDYTDPLLYLDPGALRLPTLADLYDAAAGNHPVVGMLASANWHLGMIGHGAAHPGGDRDPVVLLDEDGRTYGNEAIYSLPSIDDPARLESLTRALDGADGRADRAWRGFSLEDDLFVKKGNPARVVYQQHLLERLIASARFGADARPDMLFVNFKATDEAGHRWGPGSWQVGRVIAAQDRALGRLTTFLDRRVGRKRWAVVVTADHGQMPYRWESGAWPIAGGELLRDINARFDRDGDGIDVAGRVVSSGVYLHRSEMADNGLRPGAIARWVGAYTVAQNAQEELPARWRARASEPLFHAVMDRRRIAARSCSPPTGG
jgi:hypothetical protein